MNTKTTVTEPVGEICLYGAAHVGYGYLATDAVLPARGRLFGDGEPRAHRTLTDAFWLACFALKDAGLRGSVRVFAPAGERCAVVPDLTSPPYWRDLNWEPAPVIEISAEAILAAAEPDPRPAVTPADPFGSEPDPGGEPSYWPLGDDETERAIDVALAEETERRRWEADGLPF